MPEESQKNAVCLIVDRLQAGALGAYGNTWARTPEIDALAARSLVLDQALTDTPELLRAYRGYWRGITALAAEATSPSAALPEALSAAGVRTTLLTDERELAETTLAAGFDECVLVEPREARRCAESVEQTQLVQLLATAIQRMQQETEPFLLWIHARGMRGAWDAPQALRASLVHDDDPEPDDDARVPSRRLGDDPDPDELLAVRCAYFAQVMLLDHCVGALVEALEASDLASRTLLTLTSPRGFPLGEHGRIGDCEEALYEELIHVPWMLRMPDGAGALDRDSALVAPADMYPTLLDWFGLGNGAPPNPDLQDVGDRTTASVGKLAAGSPAWGESLMPIVAGEERPSRDRICITAASGERAFRTPAWHLRIDPAGNRELYAKPDDRWETNEVSDRCHDIAARLDAAWEDHAAAIRTGDGSQPPAELDDVLLDGIE